MRERIDAYPEFLKPACQTVSVLPSTQVFVERMFSQLKLLLRENRCRIKTELANAILFLTMNKCVYFALFFYVAGNFVFVY